MVLTYEMFVLLLNPERGLTEEEINEYRILTLKWGQAYSYGKYRENGWTSFCHRFHEHIFWDLLRLFFIIFIFIYYFFSFSFFHFFFFFSLGTQTCMPMVAG